MLKTLSKIAFTLTLTAVAFGSAQAGGEVNIYSFRQEILIKPLLDAFEKNSGIKTNVVFAKKGLIQRLVQEGANSPADILLTSGAAKLMNATRKGLTQAVNSNILNANIPANLRDPDGKWFGLTQRARLIYASKDRIAEGEIKDYEDLANPKWKGKICTRSGSHAYNNALFASMILANDEAKALTWLKGLKANLARKPSGNDRAQVKAVWQGECDIAIGNSYYMGKMLTNKDQIAWAQSVNLIFPNQDNRGTHMNISGMSLTKSSPNKANAIKLMEFLSGDMAQEIYAKVNFEYPVKSGVKPSKMVASWGKFKADKQSFAAIEANSSMASKMVDKVGYNE